jgi:hypothetical protein
MQEASMKKIIVITLIVVLLSLTVVGTALAEATPVVVKGQITAINLGTLTLSNKDGTALVILPTGFDTTTLKVGDMVLVKGVKQEDGSILATSVWVLGQKANSAYCSPEKQGRFHPQAMKIAKKYNVTPEWVMSQFCGGQSMGAIKLALRTALISGVDPETILARRTEGESWGHIWLDLGLIGSKKDGKIPPGQLKKEAKNKPGD